MRGSSGNAIHAISYILHCLLNQINIVLQQSYAATLELSDLLGKAREKIIQAVV